MPRTMRTEAGRACVSDMGISWKGLRALSQGSGAVSTKNDPCGSEMRDADGRQHDAEHGHERVELLRERGGLVEHGRDAVDDEREADEQAADQVADRPERERGGADDARGDEDGDGDDADVADALLSAVAVDGRIG